MVVSMLPDRYRCLMNCMSADLEFNILIFGAYSAGLLFASSMRASITSGFCASSLALCLECVSVPAMVLGEEVVEVVDFVLDLGVLGLGGTEANLDRGRGLKSGF